MNTDEELKNKIIENFGPMSYVHGKLNRPCIASVVFNDKEKLNLLNHLTHPATIRDAANWMMKQNHPYTVKEAALIFESGSAEFLDFVIGVKAPLAVRVKRIMDRDAVSREEVLKRMSRQVDEEIKMKLCDAVLVNDDQQLLVPQVIALHERLLKLSATL
jgi:dephospho-CoA kinase